jgi:hypothetical protein
MRYPTPEQKAGARAQNAALDFGLTRRALKFARLYAEKPRCTISNAARAAGFSDRARGAHVRGCELLRDPRVVRAILHFGALALARARGEAIESLRELAKDRRETWDWSYWHRHAVKRARQALDRLEPHARRIERVYESGRERYESYEQLKRPVTDPKHSIDDGRDREIGLAKSAGGGCG